MGLVQSSLQIKYWFVALLGILFAFLVWKIMGLEFRYAAAICGGLVVVSACMILICDITDFLILSLVFNVPFVEFSKWFLRREEVVAAKGIAVGLTELLLLIGYAVWFIRIFVARTMPLPKLSRIDFFILIFLFAQAISLLGAEDKGLSILDIIYNFKYVLLYFFLAHHVERRHLKWITAVILFTICLQSTVALYERLTGNVGIASAKGNVASEQFGTQYQVPGIEGEIRSMGTTGDSHALALYYAMLLPFPIILMMQRFWKIRQRVFMAVVVLVGVGGLVLTFARSGWLAFAIAITLGMGVVTWKWKEGRSIPFIIGIILVANAFYPKAYAYIYDRFVNAPSEIMTTRYDMNWTALSIWWDNFLFGCGPGNYLNALYDPGVTVYQKPMDLPVHNAFLWIASEMGVFGVIGFFGAIVTSMIWSWRLVRNNDNLVRGLSLAILVALTGYLLDGITDPMFRFPVPYAWLWTLMGLAVAITNMTSKRWAGASGEVNILKAEA
ncbi:MAG: O-antigen ligase family protein [Nitrospirota bacterium]|nr:O-antigen ligase family protein [Nitrospirota bacterium]